jgi:hypothetical protein
VYPLSFTKLSKGSLAQKKVKIKSCFPLTKNANYWMEVQLFISITSELGAVVSFTLRPFYPEEIRHRYPLYRRREFTPETIRTRSQGKKCSETDVNRTLVVQPACWLCSPSGHCWCYVPKYSTIHKKKNTFACARNSTQAGGSTLVCTSRHINSEFLITTRKRIINKINKLNGFFARTRHWLLPTLRSQIRRNECNAS